MKKTCFVLLSAVAGVLAGFIIIELGFRFFLLGPALTYQDNRSIDKNLFSADKRNIFFTGDSFTQGYPHPVSQSYPALLEGLLERKDVKITNFALRSTDLYDQINIIKQIADLNPALIVWGISTNDVCIPEKDKKDLSRLSDYNLQAFPAERQRINHFRRALFLLPSDCLKHKMSVFSTIKEVLVNYSYAYDFLRTRLMDNKTFKFLRAKNDMRCDLMEVQAGALAYYKKNGVLPTHVFEGALLVKNILDSKNIGFILLYAPQESDLNERLFADNVRQFGADINEYDRHNPRKSIKGFCLKNKITFIDPSGYMEGEMSRGKALFMKLDRHYNHAGNAAMAEFLSKNRDFGSFLKTTRP